MQDKAVESHGQAPSTRDLAPLHLHEQLHPGRKGAAEGAHVVARIDVADDHVQPLPEGGARFLPRTLGQRPGQACSDPRNRSLVEKHLRERPRLLGRIVAHEGFQPVFMQSVLELLGDAARARVVEAGSATLSDRT